jgi:RNA polymerase sigma-70 factor, ECF subfamily
VARSYAHSPADLDDLVQETMLQLWRAFPRFDPSQRFSTWMYRIALNVAISWQRREHTRKRHLEPGDGSLLEMIGSEPDPGANEEIALLYRAISQHEPLDRALLLLYLDGRSHRETAEVLGITPTNVATRLGRLRARLRDDLRSAGHRKGGE